MRDILGHRWRRLVSGNDAVDLYGRYAAHTAISANGSRASVLLLESDKQGLTYGQPFVVRSVPKHFYPASLPVQCRFLARMP